MNGVNLLPAPIIESQQRKRRRVLWTRSLLAYGIIMLMSLVAVQGVLIEPADALDAKRLGIESDIAASEARLGLESERREALAADLVVLTEIHGQPNWSVLLHHISEHRGNAVAIRSVRVSLFGSGAEQLTPGELARGPFAIEVSGVARTQSDVTSYVVRLERAGLLDEITLQGTSPTRIGEDRAFTFSLMARIGVQGAS